MIPAPHTPRFSDTVAEPSRALQWNGLSSSPRLPPLTPPLQPLILVLFASLDTTSTDPAVDAHALERNTGVRDVSLGPR